MVQCCSKKGPIDVDATFDKNVITSFDTVSAKFTIDMTKVTKGSL